LVRSLEPGAEGWAAAKGHANDNAMPKALQVIAARGGTRLNLPAGK